MAPSTLWPLRGFLRDLRHGMRSLVSIKLLAVFMSVALIGAIGQGVALHYIAGWYVLDAEQEGSWHLARDLARELGVTSQMNPRTLEFAKRLSEIRRQHQGIELYVLDRAGFIVNHASTQKAPLAALVMRTPLEQALKDLNFERGISGDDPMDLDGKVRFSVARFESGDLLYVALRGTTTKSLATAMLMLPHLLGALSLVVSLLVVLVVGGVIFATLVCRIRTIGESAANLAHDLKTPLASTHSHLETLLSHGDKLAPEKVGEYLGTSLKNVQTLAQLTNDLMQLWRYESSEALRIAEPLNLGDLANDVVAKFLPLAQERKIEVQLHVDPSTSLVRGDVAMLERVISNLLDNAISHSPKGGNVCIEISPRFWRKVQCTVRDNGPGLPEGEAAIIFDRFYRKNVDTEGHCGLGLAICRKIVESHRGAIWAKSGQGMGTSFVFSIPAIISRNGYSIDPMVQRKLRALRTRMLFQNSRSLP